MPKEEWSSAEMSKSKTGVKQESPSLSPLFPPLYLSVNDKHDSVHTRTQSTSGLETPKNTQIGNADR